MVVAVVACSSIPVRESQLFGPSWCGCGLSGRVDDDGPLGCHCRRLVSPSSEMPISRKTTYGVGRWVVKSTVVLLLPRMFYCMIQYGG